MKRDRIERQEKRKECERIGKERANRKRETDSKRQRQRQR